MPDTYPAWAALALIEALGSVLDEIRGETCKCKNERLNEVLTDVGRCWPEPGSAWNEKQKVTKSDSGEAKRVEPWSLLNETVRTRGQNLFAINHAARGEHRGYAGVGTDMWRKLHQAEFGRLSFEVLAGQMVPQRRNYRDLPLRILIVDNRPPEELLEYDDHWPPNVGFLFWKEAEWWTLTGGGTSGGDAGSAERTWKDRIECFTNVRTGQCCGIERWPPKGKNSTEDSTENSTQNTGPPKPHQIDLVLQDEFLGGGVSGHELAELYYHEMPQALVMLTTGLDVQGLVTGTPMPFVDRIVPKHYLAALPWYYYLAFTDVMGSMLWEPWLEANDHDETPFLAQRTTLRHLLGSLRRWRREPEILWHGQALAEMVDHGNEHISDLWRLTNEILGARKDDQTLAIGLDKVTAAERVLLALGVWLHDVGHRGDDLSTSAAHIRDVHGSISEKLLLQHPAAFALEWLLTDNKRAAQDTDPADAAQKRVAQRNRIPTPEKPLSPIHQVGLVCRHHQSSAPLFPESLLDLHNALKFPSDYARVAWRPAENGLVEDLDIVEGWRDTAHDMEWIAHDVRVLQDFCIQDQEPDLMKCTCLLRLVDALHRSHVRTGSPARRATHDLYRRNRIRWVAKRRRDIQKLLRDMPVGSQPYLEHVQELYTLELYDDLLHAQQAHLWRHSIVRNVSAAYVPAATDSSETILVTYELSASRRWNCKDFLDAKQALQNRFNSKQEFGVWQASLHDDVWCSELKGQGCGNVENGPLREVFSGVALQLQTKADGACSTRLLTFGESGTLQSPS